MFMTIDEEIDSLLKYQFLKAISSVAPGPEPLLSSLTITVAITATVHGPVPIHDNPRHVGTVLVRFDQIGLEPIELVSDQLVASSGEHRSSLNLCTNPESQLKYQIFGATPLTDLTVPVLVGMCLKL